MFAQHMWAYMTARWMLANIEVAHLTPAASLPPCRHQLAGHHSRRSSNEESLPTHQCAPLYHGRAAGACAAVDWGQHHPRPARSCAAHVCSRHRLRLYSSVRCCATPENCEIQQASASACGPAALSAAPSPPASRGELTPTTPNLPPLAGATVTPRPPCLWICCVLRASRPASTPSTSTPAFWLAASPIGPDPGG